MPIMTNNPVGPQDSLAALKALLSSSSMQNASNPGGYVQGAANREERLGEMQHNLAAFGPKGVSAALPSDISELGQDIQSDPYTGAAAHQNVAEEEALNQKMQQYGRPDVTEARQHSENLALQKLLAPIQMKGQYDVEAAKQRAESQAARDQTLMGGRADVANISQGGQNERTAATNTSHVNATRLKFLQDEKRRNPGGGLWERLTGAPQASIDRDAEIASLMGGQPQAGGAAPAAATNAPPAPAGWRYVPKPGGGWTAVPE